MEIAPTDGAIVPAIQGDFGAGDRTRTDDILLGKQTLYQLSYTRALSRTLLVYGFIQRCATAVLMPSAVTVSCTNRRGAVFARHDGP